MINKREGYETKGGLSFVYKPVTRKKRKQVTMPLSRRGWNGSHRPQLRSFSVGGRLTLDLVGKEIYSRSNMNRVEKREHVR